MKYFMRNSKLEVMRISGSVKRMALCVTAGALLGIIIGVFLGYLYATFDVPATIIIIRGINEVGFAIIFAFLGICMGVMVGTINLGPLSAATIGIAVGVAFVLFWLSFVVRVPTEPDEALSLAVIPLMALMGFLLAILRRTLLSF